MLQRQRERRALQSVAVQFWVNGVVFASFLPRLPEIRDRIGADLGQLGLLLTLGALGGLVGSALCGPLIGRVGTKRTMTLGSVGMVCSLPIVGFATGPVVFLVGLLSMQLFDVVTDVAMNMQGSWLSARRVVPVMNRLHGLWSLGTVVGGLAAAGAAATISLQTHFVAVSLILLMTVLYVVPGLLPEDDAPAPAPRPGSGPRRPSRLAVLFGLLAVMAIAVEIVPSDWAAIRLREDFDSGVGVAGLGFVAFTIGMVTGRFGGDWATARLGGPRLTRIGTVLAAAGIASATLIPPVGASLVGFFVTGLGVAVIFPRLYNDAAQAPGRPGAMLGAMTAGSRIGVLVVPVSIGALAGTAALSVGQAMAVVALPAAALLLVLRERASATSSIGSSRRDRAR